MSNWQTEAHWNLPSFSQESRERERENKSCWEYHMHIDPYWSELIDTQRKSCWQYSSFIGDPRGCSWITETHHHTSGASRKYTVLTYASVTGHRESIGQLWMTLKKKNIQAINIWRPSVKTALIICGKKGCHYMVGVLLLWTTFI